MNLVNICGCPKYPSPHASDDITLITAKVVLPEEEPVRVTLSKAFKKFGSIQFNTLLKLPALITTIIGNINSVKNINKLVEI